MTAVIFSKDMKRAEVFIPDGMPKVLSLIKKVKQNLEKRKPH
jgi:hypothetical protein